MKTLLIQNPVAGQRDIQDDLSRVTAYLGEKGWDVSVRLTRRAGHAEELARWAADQGYDMVVAVGGDGTIGEVASGLVGTSVIMGVLPVGTGNLWAKGLGLPVWSPIYRSALLDAARILVEGDRRKIDVGKAQDRYFLMWCGIGYDAKVAQDVEPHREVRRSLGNLTYLVMALAEAFFMRGTRATVVVDGRAMRHRVVMIVIANAQLYGPSLRLAPDAKLDDGQLDIYVFRGGNLIDVLRHTALLAFRRHSQSPNVEVLRGRDVYVVAQTPLPVHLDGDPVGATPVWISVLPQALCVVVPRWASASLFCGGSASEGSPITLSARLGRAWRHRLERPPGHWTDRVRLGRSSGRRGEPTDATEPGSEA
ncbi:MAG: diacylglycerol kinase family lipid kinase [Chloroflexi bacterium]|nr:diacylglycerol kinase family lipid kinase [Chloroflexota bacterium]